MKTNKNRKAGKNATESVNLQPLFLNGQTALPTLTAKEKLELCGQAAEHPDFEMSFAYSEAGMAVSARELGFAVGGMYDFSSKGPDDVMGTVFYCCENCRESDPQAWGQRHALVLLSGLAGHKLFLDTLPFNGELVRLHTHLILHVLPAVNSILKETRQFSLPLITSLTLHAMSQLNNREFRHSVAVLAEAFCEKGSLEHEEVESILSCAGATMAKTEPKEYRLTQPRLDLHPVSRVDEAVPGPSCN